jgi:hypothetical protein
MVDRATNIRVRIDIKDAMGKISQMKQGMTSLGSTGQRAGGQIQQGMNKATGAINQAGQAATKNAINFQTMGQGMLNLSTSAVQTYTSISNLARAENRAKASAVGLERAQDLLARKTLAYNKLVEAGNGNSRDAALLMKEIGTATNDLAVKTDKLKIEQEAVTDVYLLFFANMANVGVSTMMIYKTMMADMTKAGVINSLTTMKNTIATKLNTIAKWNSTKSLFGVTAASATATGGLVAQTFATKAATIATKALNFALGPVGWIIIGISAALVAYETNFRGFKDSVNGFLGIQEEFNEGVVSGTDAIETQTKSLSGQKKAFEDLSIPMQNYITLQEIAARNNNDPRELLRLAKWRGAQGFSPGGITTQQTGTSGIVSNGSADVSSGSSGAFESGNNIIPSPQQFSSGGLIPSAHGDTDTKVQQVIQTQKPQLKSQFGKNPFGNIDKRIAFYEQSYADQRDTLLSWIDNTWDNPGIQQAYVDKYWEIFDISDGFKDVKSKAQSPMDNLKAQIDGQHTGFGGITGKGKSVFAPGFAGDGNIFNFDLDNREMVKQALGVDIGVIANVINITDSIRIGSIQKQMGKFNAQPSKWVTQMKDFVTGRTKISSGGIMEMFGLSSGIESGSQSFSVRSLNQNVALGGRTSELLRTIMNLGGISANGKASATQMYQLKGELNWARKEEWLQELRERDAFVNAGGSNLVGQARTMFGGTFQLSGQRLNLGKYGFGLQNQLQRFGTTRTSAKIFGSDQIAAESLAAAEQAYLSSDNPEDPIRAAQFMMTANRIADARIDRVEKTLADGLGIDFDANSKVGTWTRYGGTRNRPLYRFNSTAKDFMKQIREDIGVSESISIPSVTRLESIALAFNENGSFSNFNNRDITGLSKEKLGITEQKIFDIRFDHTRGDRELLNRIRYIEKIEASSSGTSPL